jgi:hypothetical protein
MSNLRQGVLAGGNFITDYVKVVEAWPEQDTLASIRSESMSNGGGPYNILKNLAVLAPKLPREACGLVGEDSNGDWVAADCRAAGIDVAQLHRTSEAATSYTDAMTVASSGRRTFFHQRGANALLAPDHFDFTATRARIFMLGYLMLLDTLDAIDEDGASRKGVATRILEKLSQFGAPTFRFSIGWMIDRPHCIARIRIVPHCEEKCPHHRSRGTSHGIRPRILHSRLARHATRIGEGDLRRNSTILVATSFPTPF